MYRNIYLLGSLCSVFYNAVAGVYGNEDRIYHVSPDQHLRTPRLEDFFWTGSGDGPPPPEPQQPQPSAPQGTSVATTTVIATVYLDAFPPQAVTDKTTGDCIRNCEKLAPDGLVPEIPEDRRYWLLTVIQGAKPDSLQLRLARLYQKAFLRQQERHLGIIKSLDAPPRKKHDAQPFIINKSNEQDEGPNAEISSPDIQSYMVNHEEIAPTKVYTTNRMPKFLPESIKMYPVNHEVEKLADIKATVLKEVESWILATPLVFIEKRSVKEEKADFIEDMEDELTETPFEGIFNETLVFKREILKPEQQPPVHVYIQNVTEESETGSVQIVYVVLVGGRAVPAAVAARDMRLVRDAEVAMELGAPVNIKAEPAYLKDTEGLESEASVAPGIHGTELWALTVGTSIAALLLLSLVVLLCVAHRKKAIKSASSLRAYRDEMIREVERNRLKQVHEEKDGKLISVVSPSRSRTRPSSSLLPIYRNGSSASSTTSSGVSEATTAIRRRQKKPSALRIPQKKRVGTTDSLLEAAGLDSSDSGQQSVPQTPTSYLSMPSVTSFPRGNIVEPLSRILEPVSVSHLDLDSPVSSPKDRPRTGNVIPRRQMSSQLIRLGSIDKDPGVIGPLVWDLHCQRIKDASKPTSPTQSISKPGVSRMRQRFNELVDDTFTLFGGTTSDSHDHDTYVVDSGKRTLEDQTEITQARNDNVRLPGSPYNAMDIVRGGSAGPGRPSTSTGSIGGRPHTSMVRPERRPPARAWGTTPPQSLTPTVNRGAIMTTARLPSSDPAVPLIAAIQTEIQRVREHARQHMPHK